MSDSAEKFAAEEHDLDALRKNVEDAASVSAGLWLSYLFVLLYIAIAAGAVTHRDLLLESPVKLPFLNVELPLVAFFFLAPILFMVSHAYTLVHFVMLAAKVGVFDKELYAQLGDAPETRESLRRQLPSNIFVQFLAGPSDIRKGGLGWLLKAIAWITLVIGPVLLLLLIQVQFLPYHLEWVTWAQRFAVLIDVVLLWALWPAVLNGRSEIKWPPLWRHPVFTLASLVPIGLAFTAATVPGEAMDDWIGKRQWIPPNGFTAWLGAKNLQNEPISTSFHDLLFNGEVDKVTRRRKSLFSNTLVLPYFDALEAAKIDDPKKLDSFKHTLVLRGRHLEKAVFTSADLRKADLESVQLQGASFDDAQLQGASLNYAQLQGASLLTAQLQGASIKQAQLQDAVLVAAQLQRATLDEAQLQYAVLNSAQLQGASLYHAQLQGADLKSANLQGASLTGAQIQGASLDRAQLQEASLSHAQLQGASLSHAQLQGASLEEAQLQGASLDSAQLQGARLDEAQLQGARLDGAQLQGASLRKAGLQGASLLEARLQGASLTRAQLQAASLQKAELQGASLQEAGLQGADFDKSTLVGTNMSGVAVWRTSFDGASLTAVSEDGLKESAISKDEFVALKSMIGKELSGILGNSAWIRIEKLNPDIFGPEATDYETLEKGRGDASANQKARAAELERLACSGDESTRYIVHNLAYNLAYNTESEAVLSRFLKDTFGEAGEAYAKALGMTNRPRIYDAERFAPDLIETILGPKCPVAAALTEQDKAALKKLAKEAQPSESKP